PPVAAFTASVAGLGVSVDGSGSSDSDGTLASYAWDFGDGGTGTGATATHTYAQAGTFPVKLTVTDNAGATNTVSHDVTAVQPAGDGVLAADTFGRTVTSGFGTADKGGAWTVNGSASLFSVANGAGSMRMNTAGAGPSAFLGAVSSASADTTVKVSLDKIATGGGTFITLVGRHVGTVGEYRAKAWISATGAVTSYLTRDIGGTTTTLQSKSVAGLRYAAGEQLQIRLQVIGTSPTVLNAKVWKVGTTEPSDWTVTANDATDQLQAPGYIGVTTYASGSATNAPIVASFDDLIIKTPGTPEPPGNVPPVAAFTASVAGLGVSVDGSGSSDSDGTLASYAWDFGDGGTGSGATATHTYAQAGTFPVKLTVTDNAGATNTVSHNVVTVASPGNVPPVAAFTASVAGLGVSVDGSGSSDSDGTLASYAWDFGDGGTGSGATATHTYAQAGTFPVKLTVTDNAGATNTVSHDVTAVQPAGDGVLAADTFGRTVTSGFGTAEQGGLWRLNGSASLFSVANGAGSMRMNTAGTGPAAYLNSVASSSAETGVKFQWDKVANGGGTYTYVIGRSVGTAGEYRAKAWITSNGSVSLAATKLVAGTLTTLSTKTIPGLTYLAGDQLQIRLQVTGTSPTTLKAKLWKVGTVEPSDWTVTATDSEPGLQAAGSVGLTTYLSGSATNAPLVASFDDLAVRTIP
ncbi:PKD domain-containing protein, partial [Arthrobacter terrae]|uniref:PKD domain-containing protein n=1 Tax=Arthrobacter terrae TaxID=2935737 RepID=UPI001E504245